MYTQLIHKPFAAYNDSQSMLTTGNIKGYKITRSNGEAVTPVKRAFLVCVQNTGTATEQNTVPKRKGKSIGNK